MAQYRYAYQGVQEQIARAVGRDVPISTRQSIEICQNIRHLPVKKAIRLLEDAISLTHAIPFKRYVNGYGHKPGIAAGRFVPTASKQILRIIQNAIKNAEVKNLGSDLVIIHACTQSGSRSFKYGRQSRQKEKKCHVEIVLAPASSVTSSEEKGTKQRTAAKTAESQTGSSEKSEKTSAKKQSKSK